MTPAEIKALLAQVRDATTAMELGEIARANDLLRASRLAELTEAKELPLDKSGDELRAAIATALRLSEELQQSKRDLIAQGGNTRRAMGAYAKKPR